MDTHLTTEERCQALVQLQSTPLPTLTKKQKKYATSSNIVLARWRARRRGGLLLVTPFITALSLTACFAGLANAGFGALITGAAFVFCTIITEGELLDVFVEASEGLGRAVTQLGYNITRKEISPQAAGLAINALSGTKSRYGYNPVLLPHDQFKQLQQASSADQANKMLTAVLKCGEEKQKLETALANQHYDFTSEERQKMREAVKATEAEAQGIRLLAEQIIQDAEEQKLQAQREAAGMAKEEHLSLADSVLSRKDYF